MGLRSRFPSWFYSVVFTLFPLVAGAQCDLNYVVNPSFETVTAPCGTVPPGGLINGSFNQGCMTGWESAWGTPSVCSNNPYDGNYYACLGANNEGFFQNLSLSPDSTYCLSFWYRRLNSGSGYLDVYLANGLVNQPMSNSGNPPLPPQPEWQLLVSLPATSNNWQFAVISPFQVIDPVNTQLLFLDVPTSGLDVAIDDVRLSTLGSPPDPDVELDIFCVGQEGGTFTFEGSMDPVPPGWEAANWYWTFGDGQAGTGMVVEHTYSSFGTYEVCLSVFLTCGCEYSYCITIPYGPCFCDCGPDEEPPEILNFDPGPILVFCEDDIPDPVPPTITDCNPGAFLLFSEEITGPPCDQVIQYIWTAVDPCGLFSEVTQTIIFQDTTSPQFITMPFDVSIPCPNHELEYQVWINEWGGGEVTDECGQVALNVLYEPLLPGGCGEMPATFIATDLCGNQASAEAVFSYYDLFPPVIDNPPQDLILPCSGPETGIIEAWYDSQAGATAFDACGGVVWSSDFDGTINADSVAVIFIAEDQCELTAEVMAWIIQSHEADTVRMMDYTCDPAQVGFDSLLQIQVACSLLTVTEWLLWPSDTVRDSLFVCDPGSAGTDTIFHFNQFGCDSLLLLVSIYRPPDTTMIDIPVCDPAEEMADTMILVNGFGCDSIVITFYRFSDGDIVLTENLLICGEGVSYTDTVVMAGSPCDTIRITSYTFQSIDTTMQTIVVCQPGLAGTDTLILQGQAGCDSVILTTQVYTPPDTILQTEYRCFGPDTLEETLIWTNVSGCDSVYEIRQFVNVAPDTQFVQSYSCDSADLGTDILIVAGIVCDTVNVITTAWIPSYTTVDSITVCTAAEAGQDSAVYTSVQGCDSTHIWYFVEDRPVLDIMVSDESCTGVKDGVIRIAGIGGGSPPFQSSLNGSAFSTDSMWTDLSPGMYTVITVDALGCRDTISSLVVGMGQELNVDAGPDRVVYFGDIIDISLSSMSILEEVHWIAQDPLSCDSCIVSVLGPVTQPQIVSIMALSEAGCTVSDSFRVMLKAESGFYIPNVFSPNGDGINDYFYVAGDAGADEDYQMEIYDRWGNLVFEGKDLRVNDGGAGWNGRFDTQDLNPGVFCYVIRFSSEPQQIFSGDIMLMR